MNQRVLAVFLFALFLSPFAFTYAASKHHKAMTTKILPENFWYNIQPPKGVTKSQLDLCPLCVNVMDQTINQLLNIILNVGVIGSCGALCSYLSPYGQLAVAACNLICDGVGIKEFISLIEKADLDPIWLCQEVKLCPIHDCTDPVCARFGTTTVTPKSGPKGTEFNIITEVQILNKTGTGEVLIAILPPGAEPLEDGSLVPLGFQAGSYNMKFSAKIDDCDDCDPPVEMPTGLYKGEILVCEGMCFSHHAHSRILATTNFNFTVTN